MAVLKDSRMAVALNPDARVLHLHCLAVPVLEQYQLRGLREIKTAKEFSERDLWKGIELPEIPSCPCPPLP